MENSILNSAHTLSPKIQPTSEVEWKQMLERYEQKILKLGQEMQKVLNLALDDFQRIDPRFQGRLLIRLRSEATNKLDALKMPQERKSYLLHQLTNCHTMEDLIDLIRAINQSQLAHQPVVLADQSDEKFERDEFLIQNSRDTSNLEQDILLIMTGPQGLQLAKQSFSVVAGKVETIRVFSFGIKTENLPELRLQLDNTNALLQIPDEATDFPKEKIVHQVQETLAHLSALGIQRIGIDQKISQLTEGGLRLDPKGLILINGDHILSGLIFHRILENSFEKNIPLLNTTLGVMGILDPRVATTTLLLSDHVKKIIIFHHTPVELSPKLQRSITLLLNNISQSEEDSPVVETIRHLWKPENELLSFLSLPLVRQIFQVSTDLTLFKDVQLSLSIPSPLSNLLHQGLIKSCPLAVDLSTPFRVKAGESSISLAEAELSILSEINSPRSSDLKKHISQLIQLAQTHRFELLQ